MIDELRDLLDDLEARVIDILADLWMRYRQLEPEMVARKSKSKPRSELASDVRITRLLVPREGAGLCCTGTPAQIEAAARRMAQRTRSCVTIAVVVGQYHLKRCDQVPDGGYVPEGN